MLKGFLDRFSGTSTTETKTVVKTPVSSGARPRSNSTQSTQPKKKVEVQEEFGGEARKPFDSAAKSPARQVRAVAKPIVKREEESRFIGADLAVQEQESFGDLDLDTLTPQNTPAYNKNAVTTGGTSVAQRKREEANEDQVATFLNYQGDVLTSSGGPVEINDQQRVVAAFLDNGLLLIAKNDPHSPQAMQVRFSIGRAAREIKKEYTVELDVIRKVYENSEKRFGNTRGGKGGNGLQQMQHEFLNLVREASSKRCSDIHIKVGRYEAQMQIRSDGVMQHLKMVQSAWAHDLCAAAFNMADASDSSYRPLEYQGARISDIRTPLPEGVQAVRLQFNPLANGGRYLICRLLYASSAAESGGSHGDIDTLGYNRVHVEQIKKMRKKTFGINIISGPTGSGKSTTLQHALSALMREKRGTVNVITIEDPPEYVITGAAQLPVLNASTDEERNEKFRQAITSSLRSDPDIIMIGEIRDKASAGLAFAAAMTGHQVWASLHANDAISILDRLKDQKVEDYKLGDHTLVTGLIGQRLIRKLCPNCKIPFREARLNKEICSPQLADQVLRCLGGEKIDDVFFANADGCKQCRHGYAGRVVIAETILPDREFMNFVRAGKKDEAVKYWLDDLDGLTMLEHAVQKLVLGICDPRDVEDKAGDLEGFDESRSEIVFEKLFI